MEIKKAMRNSNKIISTHCKRKENNSDLNTLMISSKCDIKKRLNITKECVLFRRVAMYSGKNGRNQDGRIKRFWITYFVSVK